jgi:Sulfotransferase domain
VLPNLLVIGAQKCGTTSLHAYLDLHPEIAMARGKELDFFLPDRTWRQGVGWYARQFDATKPVRGESSPNYTADPLWPGIVDRAAATVPDAKLIYLVRDPIARIESHYLQSRAMAGERRPIDVALGDLDDPRNTYLCRSRYATQLEHWLARFPHEHVLVLAQEDLKTRRAQTLAAAFAFLGVDPSFTHPAMELEAHRSDDKRELTAAGASLRDSPAGALRHVLPPRIRAPLTRRVRAALSRELEPQRLPPDTRALLQERLSPEADRLRALTGLAFAGWSV